MGELSLSKGVSGSSLTNKLRLVSMTEDGIVREISSTSSIGSQDGSSPEKIGEVDPCEEKAKLFNERFGHYLDKDVARSLPGDNKNVWTSSTKSESDEERLYRLQRHIK